MKLKIKNIFKKSDVENEQTEFFVYTEDQLQAQSGRHRGSVRERRLVIVGAVCLVLVCIMLFLFFYVGSHYSVIREAERTDTNGSAYEELGDYLLRYSSDGAACLDGDGTVLWNSTFNMQSPFADICGTTVAIADRQGTQVYVFNENGRMGQFQTSMPIEKVRVAKQGAVAAVLNDGDVTWINYYDTQGKEIAKNRTSLAESGYPLDIDLSPDGLKIMVSFLRVTQGVMNTRICFYNFGPVGQSEVNNLVSEQTYENMVAPETFFLDEGTAVAFESSGFSVFTGKQTPEEHRKVEFEEEILSAFRGEKYFGFVFKSDKEKHKYRMQLYNGQGKQVMKTYFDMDYRKVRLVGSELMVLGEQKLELYNTGGRKKFSVDFGREIEDVRKLKGFRRYLVLSREKSMIVRLY